MRAPFLQDIIDETPKDVAVFVRLYADLIVRIDQLLKDKGMSQKDLAEKLGKQPSEISKWLGGDHNFTLRSIAKLQAELGEELISVPKQHAFVDFSGHVTHLMVHRNPNRLVKFSGFETYKIKPEKTRIKSPAQAS